MSNIFLSSTIGRNKHLIPREVISAIINGTEEVVRWLGNYGADITLTGGHCRFHHDRKVAQERGPKQDFPRESL